MLLKNTSPALLLIDVQQGFADSAYWGGNRNNPDAEIVCKRLLDYWRKNRWPVAHIQHASTTPESRLHPDHPGFAFHPAVTPLNGETVISKQVNSAFIGTNLKQWLDEQQIHSVVIDGLTTHHCVSTTARMSGNYGYDTYVISDATATFDRIGINGEHYPSELMHLTALASLNGEFATVLDSDTLLATLEH